MGILGSPLERAKRRCQRQLRDEDVVWWSEDVTIDWTSGLTVLGTENGLIVDSRGQGIFRREFESFVSGEQTNDRSYHLSGAGDNEGISVAFPKGPELGFGSYVNAAVERKTVAKIEIELPGGAGRLTFSARRREVGGPFGWHPSYEPESAWVWLYHPDTQLAFRDQAAPHEARLSMPARSLPSAREQHERMKVRAFGYAAQGGLVSRELAEQMSHKIVELSDFIEAHDL